ncbi:MAG: hypothetical protein AAF731_08790 [Bacteroidota bacterium]
MKHFGRATTAEVSSPNSHDTRPNGPKRYLNPYAQQDPKSNLDLLLALYFRSTKYFVFLSKQHYTAELHLARQ